ncbi:superfamily II DNA and RNA helicase [Nostoc cycadae WK-1]|uniref:Superfamily II DNA and RNA helicase n=1 Tax=Nostoc cycadae WK-1 TaxID=1861711 RepID=A0A2H6LFJ9_9NOSO|nr:superfamily II DNA and RNA helicase [Nostoc cycadae WK-1]
MSDGQYQVQQATYDDSTGEYTLFLLNSTPPTFTTENVQMARLTDEEIKAGKKSYLKVENGQPALYLTEDFKIEYVHNVTQTQNNPQTGQQETVVVRRENSFWSPFAGSLAGSIAGQAIGSLLFRPQYYVPPVYQPGGVLTGFGGYGSTYDQAVSSYRSRYNAPPAAVRNRTAFRTTGNIRRTYPSGSNVRTTTPSRTTNRPSGSGFGSSELRPSGRSSTTRRNSGSSFGSGGRSRTPSRSGGFGSRRR